MGDQRCPSCGIFWVQYYEDAQPIIDERHTVKWDDDGRPSLVSCNVSEALEERH